MSTLTDIRTGVVVKLDGKPYLVVWHQFNRKQQRKPVMRTKLKNLIDDSTLEKTFLAGESFEFADIETARCQYLYNDGNEAFFMNNESFEQFALPFSLVEESLQFIKDDIEVYVTFYESRPIGIQPPPKTELKVVETVPGVKGDTATGGTKPAKLETGATVNVPLFIVEGDVILVNTETGEYVKRV
ncbi:elongation factor P [Candidatus Peregrinibacteria bacterium CG_4_10_14_0_2_um_filter_43_11]|nr:MAG: elongation factor P [Candidatus Peregrinibacteria bacterium CG_4_10_14_0_2_um_filter_43_11]